MIDIRSREIALIALLEAYLQCPVIRQNRTDPVPDCDYVSYTITRPFIANGDHYGRMPGLRGKPMKQGWSFTCLSSEQENSQQLAMNLHTYFDGLGEIPLSDQGFIVFDVTDITTRDTLLTVDYAYRNGFDVVFSFAQVITESEEINQDQINHVKINQKR